jgi:hypothetical protein
VAAIWFQIATAVREMRVRQIRGRSFRELVLEALGAPAGGFQDIIQFQYGGRRFYARFSIRPPLQRREGNPHCMPLVQRQRVQPGGNLGRTGVCHRLSD